MKGNPSMQDDMDDTEAIEGHHKPIANALAKFHTYKTRALAKPPEVWMPAFLSHFRTNLNITISAGLAGVSTPTVYKYLKVDPAFKEQYDSARLEAVDFLQAHAVKRATEGYPGRPVVTKDGRIIEVIEYSDRMLEMLLKAHAPEVFSDKHRLEHSGPGGKPMQIVQLIEEANNGGFKLGGDEEDK